jgi:triosephosphate isomerase
MLVDAGCRYVIIGHSERRRIFNETNDLINKKVAAALKSGLNPIVCIGETKEERLEGKTFSVLDKQISESLDFFESDDLVETVIAYEPVWAIGTGLTATPQQAQEAHSFIRKKVSDMFGSDFADTKIRIQYGGSVKSDNIKAIMANPDVDGALIGGASLDPEGFFKIISFDR